MPSYVCSPSLACACPTQTVSPTAMTTSPDHDPHTPSGPARERRGGPRPGSVARALEPVLELPALPAACGAGPRHDLEQGPGSFGEWRPGAAATPRCALCAGGLVHGRPAGDCGPLVRERGRGDLSSPLSLWPRSPARGWAALTLGRVGAESERSSPSPAPPADGRRRAGRTVPPPPAPTVSSLSPPRRILCADFQQAQGSPSSTCPLQKAGVLAGHVGPVGLDAGLSGLPSSAGLLRLTLE